MKLLVIKQESGRHAETLDAITQYLDMGKYSEWDEDKRLEFLTKELKGKRPLVPPSIEVMLYDLTRMSVISCIWHLKQCLPRVI